MRPLLFQICALPLLLLSGCGNPSPENVMRDIEEALVEHAVDEALLLAYPGHTVLLPNPVPADSGRPHAIDPTYITRVREAVEAADAEYVYLPMPGPARYDEAENFFTDKPLFDAIKKCEGPVVVLFLLPPPAHWSSKTLAPLQAKGVKFVVATLYGIPGKTAWPESFPDVLMIPRETEAPLDADTFDQHFEIQRSSAE